MKEYWVKEAGVWHHLQIADGKQYEDGEMASYDLAWRLDKAEEVRVPTYQENP